MERFLQSLDTLVTEAATSAPTPMARTGNTTTEAVDVKKILVAQVALLTNMHKTVLKVAGTVRAEREKIDALAEVVLTEVDRRESIVTLLNKIVMLLSADVDPSEKTMKRRISTKTEQLAKKRRVYVRGEANDEEENVQDSNPLLISERSLENLFADRT